MPKHNEIDRRLPSLSRDAGILYRAPAGSPPRRPPSRRDKVGEILEKAGRTIANTLDILPSKKEEIKEIALRQGELAANRGELRKQLSEDTFGLFGDHRNAWWKAGFDLTRGKAEGKKAETVLRRHAQTFGQNPDNTDEGWSEERKRIIQEHIEKNDINTEMAQKAFYGVLDAHMESYNIFRTISVASKTQATAEILTAAMIQVSQDGDNVTKKTIPVVWIG